MLAGRRLLGGEPLFHARRRLVERRVERPLQPDVPLPGRQLAQHVGQVVAQNRTQPARRPPPRLAACVRIVNQALVSFQQRLLDDPGEVDLVAQPRGDLQPGQQAQVGAEPLQVLGLERSQSTIPGVAGVGHRGSMQPAYWSGCPNAGPGSRDCGPRPSCSILHVHGGLNSRNHVPGSPDSFGAGIGGVDGRIQFGLAGQRRPLRRRPARAGPGHRGGRPGGHASGPIIAAAVSPRRRASFLSSAAIVATGLAAPRHALSIGAAHPPVAEPGDRCSDRCPR